MTLKNYHELLARERAETEGRYIAVLAAREAAENRRRLSQGWAVRPALFPILEKLGLASKQPEQGE
jgi:hypothetical protein